MKVCPVRLVAVILSALLFISFLPVNAEQSVSSLSTSVWTQHLGENLLSSVAVKNDTICFEYDDNGYRTSKRTAQGNTTYVYNPDAQLVSEDRGDYLVNYYYDVLGFITGCSINGSNYSYTLDDNRSVVSLLDSTGECVAKYTYAGSKVNVLGKNSQGRWVDKAKDNSFIGNINKITLYSMYFDSETGFFYNGLKYYDAEKNEYLCDPSVSLIITPMVSQQVAAQVATWQQSLLSSSTFGQAINYTSSWYSNLSDVELLTRLFYGENTQNSYDQNGVTWVVINRKINNYGGGTFRGVATQSGQFEPITGNSSGTTNARVPSTSSPRWRTATWNACSLLTTASLSDYADLVAKPVGISSQLYFVGLNYFMGNPPSRDASPSGIEYSFNGGSTFVKIKDIVIVFDGSSSFQNPSNKAAITSNPNLNTSSLRSTHNIFFNQQ